MLITLSNMGLVAKSETDIAVDDLPIIIQFYAVGLPLITVAQPAAGRHSQSVHWNLNSCTAARI